MNELPETELSKEQIEQFMDEFKRLNVRPACILEVGGFRPTGDPLASNIGLAPVMRPDETWPHDNEGRPMQFIAQLNLTDAPFVPEILADLSLITLFVGQDCIQQRFKSGSWQLRAYESLNGLEATLAPSQLWPWLRGFECRWQVVTDYPSYDDNELILPAGFSLEQDLPEEMHGLNVARSKVGGFASSIQHEVEFNPAIQTPQGWQSGPAIPFAFQIQSEEKANLMWADNGCLYVGRQPNTDEWFASCQFY